MKRGIEERRNEAFVCKPDPSPPSPSEEVGKKGLGALVCIYPGSGSCEGRGFMGAGPADELVNGTGSTLAGQVAAEGWLDKGYR